MPLAFSYQRFSSLKQRHGASTERQLEAARRYAERHSLTLDTSTYRDLGVSAFRSKNVEGALGAFIQAVDAKKIPPGSYLLIESFDRLSRDTVDVALELMLSITRKGVVIVTLMDDQVYSSTTIKENWTKLIMALAVMARAHEESLTKSKRAHDAIKRRAERGEIPTTRLPTWMRFSNDRKKAILISDRASTVKRIFEWAQQGVGARECARRLNKEKTPVLFYAKEWRQSAVSQLLRNPAAYGQFQDKDGVLPAVVTKAKFLKAQSIIDGRKLFKGAAAANPNNIFAGLSRCGHCERAMRFLPRKKNWYMKCVGSSDLKNCEGRMFPFQACEAALIYQLAHHSQEHVGRDFFEEQNDRREQLEAEIRSNKERQKKVLQVAALADDVEVVAEELKRLQTQINVLEKELGDLAGFELTDREKHESAALFDIYIKFADDELRDWNPHGDQTSDITAFRQKLKLILARLVKRIEFKNGKPKGWQPELWVTYVSGTRTIIDVTNFLPSKTQAQIANGTPHRSDLGKSKARKKR
jgi:DNA invertase Pin-like site-specific DNA recombinase